MRWWNLRRPPLPAGLLLASGLLARLAQGSDESVGSKFWHHMCGAVGTDEHPAPGPLDIDGYKFVALSILIRHGARNFLDDPRTVCYPHPPPSMAHAPPTHAVHPQVAKAMPPPSMASFPFESPAEVETLDEPPALDDDNRCRGCLLSDARPEFETLGKAVQKNYFSVLPSQPSLESSWLYATNQSRNIASLFLLLGGLFPDLKHKSIPQFHTRPLFNDIWAGIPHCPSAVSQVLTNRSLSASQAPFGQRWSREVGQNWTWPCHDPMVVATCSGRWKEMLGLPVSEDSAIIKEAWDVYAELYIARYVDHTEAFRLMSAPIILELYDSLRRQASGDGPPVALWSTQDIVIVAILQGLGLWDRVWPQYAEATIFELYTSDKHSKQHFFRLLRRGVPIKACSDPTPDGLCDLDSWLPDDLLALRNETLWEEQCTPVAAPAVPAESVVALTSYYLVLALVAALLCGYGAFRLLRPRSSRDSSMTEPLVAGGRSS